MKKNIIKKFKNYCVYLYQKHPTRTIFGVILFVFFLLLVIINETDTINLRDILIIYALYIISLLVLLPVIRELLLYDEYHRTLKHLEHLEYSIENHSDKTVQYKLTNFIKIYDSLRKNIKRSVTNSKSHLYSHKQETVCILKDTDLFFDVTIKLIMKKEDDLYTNNLSTDNLDIIYNFLKTFDKFAFIDFNFSNILLVDKFFEKHNSYLEKTHADLFEKTKTSIDNHYLDKSRYSNLLSSIVMPIILALVPLVPITITVILELVPIAITAIRDYYI